MKEYKRLYYLMKKYTYVNINGKKEIILDFLNQKAL